MDRQSDRRPRRAGRAFALLAAVSACIIPLVGCGSSGGSASQASGGNSQSSTSNGKTKARIAVLFPGRINDHAFNQAGYNGILRAKKQLPVSISYSENVAQPDFASTMRNYAQAGFTAVIGFGFQFVSAAQQVSKQFPKVDFAVVSADASQPPNLGSFKAEEWQSFYLAGVAAAKITKTGTVGYIGGTPIPVLVQDGNAFKAGAESANPKVKTIVTYTGSLNDISAGQQTALTLIGQGADVVLGNANVEGIGVIKAATSKNVWAMGAQFDQTSVAPKTVVASAVVRQDVALFNGMQLITDGKFQPKSYVWGLKDHSTNLGWNPAFKNRFPAAVKALNAAKKDVVAGKVPVPSTKQ